jgi:putative sigma-54 modulation protein
MYLNISFKQIDPSDAIKTYATEKSDKLAKYFRGRISVSWIFSMERQNFVAHCHLVGNNMDYFGEARTTDLHASVDEAIDRIEKQLRKHKEIVKGHHLHRDRATGSSSAA